mgnify:CR=1 FL=1
MSVRVEILHPQRLVKVVMEGQVRLQDMEEHFDAIVRGNAMGYAKLVDCTHAEPIYDDHDALMMGARLSAYAATMPAGPLAVFGGTDEVNLAFARFVNLSPSRRPARLFKTEAKARAWLALQQQEPPSS